MAEALLVKMIWLFLPLILSHVSAQSFSVVVPKTPVSGQIGGSVTLPCTISDNLDVRKLEVRWYRPKMYNSPALLYQNEKLEPSADGEYRGRVSLPGPLEKGDVSLKLDNLTLKDEGTYMCHVSSDRWYDKNNVSLIIQAVGSSPILSMVDAGEGKVNVSCRSHGWLPKPSLTWRDNKGRSLEIPNEHTSTKVSEGLFSVSSWLLFSPSENSWVSCSVALPDSVGVMRESRVMPHVPPAHDKWKGAAIGTFIALLLCIIAVGVYYVVKRQVSKRKKAEGREGGPALREGENQPLMESQTADKSLQSVFTVNHDQKPEPNVNSSPSAESQTVNEVEEQQPLQTQNEYKPHQNTGGNHDQDPQRNQNSSPPAGGEQGKNAGANQNASTSAGGDEGKKAEAKKNSSPPAGGDQGKNAGANQKPSPPAEGEQNQNAEPTQKSSPPAGRNHEQDHQLNVTSPQSAGTENQLVNPSELNLKEPFTPAELQKVKQFKKVKITIDPEETPEFFRTTQGGTRVNCLQPNENHEEEKRKIFTLCRERFSSGQQYWELKVKDNKSKKLSWFVGVATEEAEKIDRIPLTPQNGFWVLCYEEEKRVFIRESPTLPTPLPYVSDDLSVIGVFLDCDNHILSFYNAETQSHIYTFTSVTPRTSLRPLISPGIRDTVPVKIC